MRIRTKITLGYLLIAFLVAIAGYAGILNIKKTEAESGRVIDGSIKTIQTIHNLRYYGLDLIANTTEILFLQAESRGSNISELAAGPSEIIMLREKTLFAFDRAMTQYAHLSDQANSGRRDHTAHIRDLSELLKMRSAEIINVVSRPVRPDSEVVEATRRMGEVKTAFTKAIDDGISLRKPTDGRTISYG